MVGPFLVNREQGTECRTGLEGVSLFWAQGYSNMQTQSQDPGLLTSNPDQLLSDFCS